MNSQINLLARDTDELEKKQKRLRFVRFIALLCLALVAAASVITFILNSQVRIEAIKKDQDAALSQITAEKEKAAKLYLVKDRILHTSALLTKRKKYIQTLAPLLQTPPTGLSVSGVTIESNLLTISVSGSSLSSINAFIDSFVNIGDHDTELRNLTIQDFVLDSITSVFTLTVKSDLI